MSIIKYLATVFVSVPSLAQTNATFLLTSSNTVSPGSPTTTIGIWATWTDPGILFVFGAGDYDLTASDGQFSNPVNVLRGPGSSTGVIVGNVISGAVNGQLNIPSLPPTPAINPILVATYDWTTTDFMPRTVDLDTSNATVFTVSFLRYPKPTLYVELYPDEFFPGSGVIIVEGDCYADCDRSGVLDLFDFLCFQNSFVNGEPYACDCDITTGTNPPVCDIFDFLCFQNAFVVGCP